MTDNHSFSIQINLGGMTGRIQRLLHYAGSVVAIGLNAEKGITTETLALPDVTINQQFASPLPVQEAQETWRLWVLRNGFRDVAEAVGGVLEEAQTALAYWSIIMLQRERLLTRGDLNEIVVHRCKQFHKRTLPQRLEFLYKQYAFSLDQSLVKQLLSINAARNCLTHRGGVVAELDLDSTGNLTTEWSALVMLALGANGEETEIAPGFVTQVGTSLGFATRPKSKQFALGQHIAFSSNEFNQICWTLFQFSVSCAKNLESWAKGNGFPFKEGNVAQQSD